MTLNKALGIALDRIKQELSALEPFTRLKVSGQELRRYFHESQRQQREICFYRDKWWNREGGILHGELFSLVPEVQMALAGQSQSLADPDYAIPFEHFQYSLSNHEVEHSWTIGSLAEVSDFESRIRVWLSETALPWFEQFESLPGVVHFLEAQKQWLRLALWLNSQGESERARNHLLSWLNTLPRQIDPMLNELAAAGLLSSDECKVLGRASLQETGIYREAVERFSDKAS